MKADQLLTDLLYYNRYNQLQKYLRQCTSFKLIGRLWVLVVLVTPPPPPHFSKSREHALNFGGTTLLVRGWEGEGVCLTSQMCDWE